jgi:RNA polymerase sigma-70 factor (ECF subfamily)
MGIYPGARGELLELVDVGGPATATGSAPPLVDDFDSFYRREAPSLLVLARVLAGPSNAEDVVQETMLAAYRRWDEVRGYASPVGWIRTVCLRKAVSMVRRRSLEQRAFRQLGAFRSDRQTPLAEDEPLWAAVRALPLRQAQAIALYYVLDLSVADIADTLGCAVGTVKSHLVRGRAALAQTWDLQEESPR